MPRSLDQSLEQRARSAGPGLELTRQGLAVAERERAAVPVAPPDAGDAGGCARAASALPKYVAPAAARAAIVNVRRSVVVIVVIGGRRDRRRHS